AALRELDDRARELRLRRNEVEVLETRLPDDVRERRAVEQVVRRDRAGALAEPGRCIGLRVEIDDERACSGLRETSGEIDRRGRLADAALLVRKRVDRGGQSRILPSRADGS